MPCSRNSTETLESPYHLFLFLRSERRILVGVIEAPSNSASLGSSDHKSGVSRSLLTSLSRLLMRGGIFAQEYASYGQVGPFPATNLPV